MRMCEHWLARAKSRVYTALNIYKLLSLSHDQKLICGFIDGFLEHNILLAKQIHERPHVMLDIIYFATNPEGVEMLANFIGRQITELALA